MGLSGGEVLSVLT